MYRNIHIGKYIKLRMTEIGMDQGTLAGKLRQSPEQLQGIFSSGDITCHQLLKISRILSYDFFRIYSMNIILYSPPNMGFAIKPEKGQRKGNGTRMPNFIKNTYTPQVISYIVSLYRSGELSAAEMTQKYRIPKTTLYRWLKKYNTPGNEL